MSETIEKTMQKNCKLKELLAPYDFEYEIVYNDSAEEHYLRKRLVSEGSLSADAINTPLIKLIDTTGTLSEVSDVRFVPLAETLVEEIFDRLHIFIETPLYESFQEVLEDDADWRLSFEDLVKKVSTYEGVSEEDLQLAQYVLHPESVDISDILNQEEEQYKETVKRSYVIIVSESFNDDVPVYLFDSLGEARAALLSLWEDAYNTELVESECGIIEEETYIEDEFAKITWCDREYRTYKICQAQSFHKPGQDDQVKDEPSEDIIYEASIFCCTSNEVGKVKAKTLPQLKRLASMTCNHYRSNLDVMYIQKYKGKEIVDGLSFVRKNTLLRNGDIIRGNWNF